MVEGESVFKLEEILAKVAGGGDLEKTEVLFLLNLEQDDETELLFRLARDLRNRHLGNELFLYGFIYFSTYCRNDCAFCLYRRSNEACKRYRKSRTEIIETADQLTASGVHLLDLTLGEDPYFFDQGHFDQLLELVAEVKNRSGLPVMISPGVVSHDALKSFQQIGVDWYALYQETHNRELFSRLRLEQNYFERLNLKRYAHGLGMLTEEGLLAGIGETVEDLYHSFEVMKELSADQVRVMSFIPQVGTPLENYQTGPHLRELLIIAIMRLLFPDRLIPASLDVDGLSGLKQRLNAGANVVTSIIPPNQGLQGVSQSTLDVDEGGRSVSGITPVLKECGLKPAAVESYKNWVDQRKQLYAKRG
jgi:methylornithine synthase